MSRPGARRAGAAEWDDAEAVHVAAPAKLNLYLHVTGKRADGYHLLDSLIAFAAVHDTVSVKPAATLALELAGPFAATLRHESDNLVLRAARVLAATAGVKPGARIRLIKRLPVASGIGGGSADAAATLKALARLWQVDDAVDLAALALPLGADVPMCLAGRAAVASGIGEHLAPVPPLPPAALVLANPMARLQTNRVFQARTGAFSKPGAPLGPGADAAALALALADRRNDLTVPAVGLRPQIRVVLDALTASEGCLLARMSGSGATCFGLYADDATAARAAAAIAAKHRGWWICATRLLDDAAALGAPDLAIESRAGKS
ncbi:MAG: 4-(cytidine 5'-diphospho)-2-C-methyl-D-erythritol kinase [Candidatus Eiseniibacteriota bacterium]